MREDHGGRGDREGLSLSGVACVGEVDHPEKCERCRAGLKEPFGNLSSCGGKKKKGEGNTTHMPIRFISRSISFPASEMPP